MLNLNVLYTVSKHVLLFPVSANEGDSYPLGALPIGSLFNNLEIYPGKGAQYVRAAGKGNNVIRVMESQLRFHVYLGIKIKL